MSLRETAYRAAVDGLIPWQTMARLVGMIDCTWRNIARRITGQHGPLFLAEPLWRVAQSLSSDEPVCRRLIEEQLARVSA